MESQYDVIIIGSGDSGQAAVEALKKQGKTALLIDLRPEMVTTIISQSPSQPSLGGQPSSQISEPIAIGDGTSQMVLHKHTIQTSASETITYTLQVQAHEEVEPSTVTFYPEMDVEVDSPELVKIEKETGKHEEDLQMSAEAESPHQFLRERENSLRDKLIRRKAKAAFHEQTPNHEIDYPVYHLDRIKIDDEHQLEEDPWNDQQPMVHAQTEEVVDQQESSSAYDQLEPPIYRERELKLRKRLIGSIQRLYGTDPKSVSAKPVEPYTQQPFEEKSPQTGQVDPFAPSHPTYFEQEHESSELEQRERPSEIYPLEPFSSRRRSRAQKKNRMGQNVESIESKKAQKSLKKSQPATWEESPFSSASYNHEPSFDGMLFGNGTPSIQPFKREPFQKEAEQDPEPDQQMNNNDNLKRDDIEFEDAYGGYNSWEEFMTPFSQNSRKRQEMDKIEKRKIALRGLHNLINNLG